MNKITALLSLTITISISNLNAMLPAPAAAIIYQPYIIEITDPITGAMREQIDIANISDGEFAALKQEFVHNIKQLNKLAAARKKARR